MGIIWLLLIAAGVTTKDHLPYWVVASCFLAIGLGTLFGGWRIVKTMGQRITKLKPVGGFAAETGGAISVGLATFLGIPVSTTHTITGAIVGVGAAQRSSAVRWGVAGNIVIAWIITIPASAGIAALAWWIGGAVLLRAASGARMDMQAAAHGGPREKCIQRTLHVREVAEAHQLAGAVEADEIAHHRKDRDVGNGVFIAHHPCARREVPVDDAEQAARLGGVAIARTLVFATRVPANLWKKPSWPNIGPMPPTWKNTHCRHW